MSKNPHAVALGKLGGKAKTDAKVEAARLNGRKGGRPRKDDLSKPMSAENIDLVRNQKRIQKKYEKNITKS
jgi:hypothetical protein